MPVSVSADIHVAAGVLQDEQGNVLIAQRPPGSPLAGAWEFPGGKINSGEAPLQGLVRELREELNVHVRYARHLVRYNHTEQQHRIWLYVWRVLAWRGELRGAEGQALRWMPVGDLMAAGLLRADERIVECLLRPVPANLCPNFSVAADCAAPQAPGSAHG